MADQLPCRIVEVRLKNDLFGVLVIDLRTRQITEYDA